MLAWVDVETTGLDPKTDILLEVGFILTSDTLEELDRTNVVFPFNSAHPQNTLGPEVFEMHTKSGLLAECEAQEFDRDDLTAYLAVWLSQRLDAENPPPLAGSTVGFDRSFLKADLPEIVNLFHYRSVDVSTLKELNRRWSFADPWEFDRDLHRSLADLEDSISELRWYRTAMLNG